MTKAHSRIEAQGEVRIQILDEHGEVESVQVYNALTLNMAALCADLLADKGAIPVVDYIALGTGALTEYGVANSDTDKELTSSGADQQLAQEFQVSTGAEISYVLIYLKRVGTSAATLTAEIQTDSAGLPSGTPVTHGISDSVSFNSLDTDYELIRFDFDPDNRPTLVGSTVYHLVLKATGYTYASGTTEINVATDTSSPGYASGELESYNGSAWSAASPDADMIFRIVPQSLGTDSDILGETVRNQMTSKTTVGAAGARLLANFASDEGVGYIGQIAMFNDDVGGSMFAIATVHLNKPSNKAINVYWTITFTIVDDED